MGRTMGSTFGGFISHLRRSCPRLGRGSVYFYYLMGVGIGVRSLSSVCYIDGTTVAGHGCQVGARGVRVSSRALDLSTVLRGFK